MNPRWEALRAAAEAATLGPWKWWTSNSWRRLKHDSAGLSMNVAEPYVCSDGHPDLSIKQEDMAYIALASPSEVLALLDELDDWRAELERLGAVYRVDHGSWVEAANAQKARGDGAEARAARLEAALRNMVYETTHLSVEREDGSHHCFISKGALSEARAALSRAEAPIISAQDPAILQASLDALGPSADGAVERDGS